MRNTSNSTINHKLASKLVNGVKSSISILLIYLGTLLIAAKPSQAQQVFPVLANMQVNPPYSPYLSDYTAAGTNKLQLNLFLKDLTKTNYQCRLRLKIEGLGITIQSKNDFPVVPLTLNGGELSTFSGIELASYLNPQNLVFQGIDETEIRRNGGKLPEGLYRFTIEVQDYYRRTVVSNAALAVMPIFLAYPPIINLPLNGSRVTATEPQNVIFQWTPRNAASTSSAYNTAYNVKLVEIIPANRDANDAIRSSRPIYETYTERTMLVYGPAEPALTPGASYALQVQAIEAEGRELFVNNGYSEVVRFTYGERCPTPPSVTLELAGTHAVKVSWAIMPGQQAFSIRYRQAGNPTAQWFEKETYTSSETIDGLRPSTSYEFQVKAQCTYGYGDYSETQTFNMPDEDFSKGDFVCGRADDGALSDQGSPLLLLRPSMIFIAGKFPVKVTTASGGNGVYSGTGTLGVPFLNYLSFKVSFQDIRINTELKMTSGKVVFVRQQLEQSIEDGIKSITVAPDENGNVTAINSNGLPTIIDAAITSWPQAMPVYDAASKTVKFSASVNGGAPKEITLKLVDGQPPLTFQDKNQETFKVDEQGKVTYMGRENPTQFFGSGASTNFTIDTSRGKVAFAPNSGQQYGFDGYDTGLAAKSKTYAADYLPLNDGEDTHRASWKSMESRQFDKVRAILSITDPKLDPKKLAFVTGRGDTLGSTLQNDNTYIISLAGALPGNGSEIYAVYPPDKGAAKGAGGTYMGRLNIYSYAKLSKKLVIVPVNGASTGIDATALEGGLNRIYQQAVAEWKVELAGNFKTDAGFDNLDNGNSSSMSAYTEAQKRLAKDYRDAGNRMDDGTYYIFVVKALSNGDAGYMVRGGQVGFVSSTDVRTIAHELGHGAYKLQHTWDQYGLAKGSTNNLMDYASGTELWYGQWRYMRNPDVIFRPLEGDDEGAIKSGWWLTTNWQLFKGLTNYTPITSMADKNRPQGTVSAIVNKNDNNIYVYNDKLKDYYYLNTPLKITTTEDIPAEEKIYLFKSDGSCANSEARSIPYKYLKLYKTDTTKLLSVSTFEYKFKCINYVDINEKITNWNESTAKLTDYINEYLKKDEDYSKLSASARASILTKLGSLTNIDGCWIKNERECPEGQILNTLKYASPADYPKIIEVLSANKYSIFFNLYNKIDNHGLGAYNFDILLTEVTKIVMSETSLNFDELKDKNNIFYYKREPYDASTTAPLFSTTRYFGYDALEKEGMFRIRTYTLGPQGAAIDNGKTMFNPFEIVAVYAEDEYYPNSVNSIGYKPKTLTIIPSFLYAGLEKSEKGKTTSSNVKTAVQFVALSVSLGTGGATSGLTSLLNFVDAVAITESMVASSGLINDVKIKYGENSAQYQSAYYADEFFKLYGYFRLGQATTGLLKAASLKVLSISGADLTTLENNFPSVFEKIKQSRIAASKFLNQAISPITNASDILANYASKFGSYFKKTAVTGMMSLSLVASDVPTIAKTATNIEVNVLTSGLTKLNSSVEEAIKTQSSAAMQKISSALAQSDDVLISSTLGAKQTGKMAMVAVKDYDLLAIKLNASIPMLLIAIHRETQQIYQPVKVNDEQDQNKCTICNTEPLICTLQQKATFAQKDAALAKLCQQLTVGNLKPVAAKLNTFTVSNLNAFLSDVLTVPATCNGTSAPESPLPTNISSLTVNMVDAWDIYKEAGRNCLKLSTTRMKDLGIAINNNKLSEKPYQFTRTNFLDIAKAGNSANEFAEKFDKTVFVNLVKFAGVSATYQNTDKLKAKLSQQNSGPTLEGTNFIVKYMGDHASEFNGGNYTFEAYDNAWARYVDVEDRRSGVLETYIYYEFKSIEESNFKPDDFIDQFVKDLQKANSLSQIRWIFDHEKMDASTVKTKVLKALRDNKGMLDVLLTSGKLQSFFPANTIINSTDNFIDELSKNSIFDEIFK